MFLVGLHGDGSIYLLHTLCCSQSIINLKNFFLIASSGFRDGISFNGFGSIDYDLEQETSTFLFEAGQYNLLNWNDVNGSLIIEFSGFIAKCRLPTGNF